MKATKSFLAVLFLVLLLSSCMTLTHTVGTGGSTGVKVEQKQWYALWGLVPINHVDSKAMAGGTANYTIQSQVKFVDYIIAAFTEIVTINVQTVTVIK
jgi:PBP1b-binding outer membrane lipoprotein LpoB